MLAPTLLVGLGGIGSKIISKVAARVSEEVDELQQNRIAYAVFDTDINELQEIHQKNPRITPIQTSTKLTVGEYLNLDDHARDDWFPVNPILNSKTLTEGAGQVRAISRLALETAIRAGKMDPLHKTVESLYKLEQNQAEQALRVVVASSLCGGTGSGLILPVALYLRNYLQTRFRQSANIMRGFFIMPEVFYHVIHGESERNNLRCNAYATIRELDAFLMKGDGTLPAQFEDTFKIMFPRPGSNEIEEYKVRPYDFCFLFDAQNTEGRKLNDFGQYLDHAANCIFTQSIGPMNKRSNSSEDNTIRELCAERGRNRYAGAGSSSIIYPLKDVEEYIALDWTKQCVSNTWLQFDKRFNEKGKTKEKRDRQKDYCNSVCDKAKENNALAKYIIEQCVIPGESALDKGENRWDNYVDALMREGEDRWTNIESIQEDLEDCLDSVKDQEEGEPEDDRVRAALRKMSELSKDLLKGIEQSKTDIAKSMFADKDISAQDELPQYALLNFIKDGQGKLMHPNAIRYFLYRAREAVVSSYDEVNRAIGDDDGGKRRDVKKLSKDLDEKDKNRKGGLFGGGSDKLEDKTGAIDIIKRAATLLPEYKKLALQEAILACAKDYLKNLCESFEAFYDSLQQGIDDVEKTCSLISKKYKPMPGKTTRYVCASQKMLEKMVVSNPYMGDTNSVNDELAINILNKVIEYASLSASESEKRQGFFTGMFKEEIVGHFKKELRDAHSSKVYMNVLDAIEREVELENNEADPTKLNQAVSDIINDTRKLANPFIETPLGEQRAPISACSYHPSLNPRDDSPRSTLIGSALDNFGAVPDEDIPETMILFYQSVYGLRANNLSKFAPPKKLLSSNDTRGAGEYFKSYFDIVNQIVPKTDKTPVVTPHIDRNWHVITVLPDLDDNNQKAQEDRIYRAFMYAWLYNKIKYTRGYGGHWIYQLNIKGSSTEDFVVSNKTPCDRYYEVLDALTINPVVVNNLISVAEEKINKEMNKTCSLNFEKSMLVRALGDLKIEEVGSRNEDGEIEGRFKYTDLTLIDLPVILKQSAPPSEFRTVVGCDMLISMFKAMLEYLKRMTPAMKVPDEFGKFVKSQYYKFKDNCSRYDNYDFRDYFWSLIRTLIELLQDDEFADSDIGDIGEEIERDFDDYVDSLDETL